ncbi:hypothetical protein [Streptomyces sp. NPDC003023]|uniref:hypothetical protein n=1 Tax=Streptomyces sp. NPDC003023 TaxID=3364675 RepID=UPI003673A795
MRNPIAALLASLLGVLAPGSGRRRACAGPVASAKPRRTHTAPPGLDEPSTRAGGPPAVRPRSPYGLVETLHGEDTALIRPYLVEHERQERRTRQRRRCLTLVMAADFGIDLDTRNVHATGVAW